MLVGTEEMGKELLQQVMQARTSYAMSGTDMNSGATGAAGCRI